MFPIAGQTAGPIGLKFVVDTDGWPGVLKAKKKSKFFFQKIFFSKIYFFKILFFQNFFFYGQRRALRLVLNKFEKDVIRHKYTHLKTQKQRK